MMSTFIGAPSVFGGYRRYLPAYEGDRAIRVEFFGDDVEDITEMDHTRRGDPKCRVEIFPALTTWRKQARCSVPWRASAQNWPRLNELKRGNLSCRNA